jgi:hypothetical protein
VNTTEVVPAVFSLLTKGRACMSPHHLRFFAAGATSVTLLAFVVAGRSPGPSALLLTAIGLVAPVIMRLWIGTPAIATAATERQS